MSKPIARLVLTLLEVAGGIEQVPMADMFRLLAYVLRADRPIVIASTPDEHKRDVELFFMAMENDCNRRARELESVALPRGNA